MKVSVIGIEIKKGKLYNCLQVIKVIKKTVWVCVVNVI